MDILFAPGLIRNLDSSIKFINSLFSIYISSASQIFCRLLLLFFGYTTPIFTLDPLAASANALRYVPTRLEFNFSILLYDLHRICMLSLMRDKIWGIISESQITRSSLGKFYWLVLHPISPCSLFQIPDTPFWKHWAATIWRSTCCLSQAGLLVMRGNLCFFILFCSHGNLQRLS